MSAGGHVAPDSYERRIAALRERLAPRRLFRAPWGWEVYMPGKDGVSDVISAQTLDELEEKLGQQADSPGRDN